MRFLFGLTLGLLIPVAVRAMKDTGRPVALEPIRGGLAMSESKGAEPQTAGTVKKSVPPAEPKASSEVSGTKGSEPDMSEDSGKTEGESGSED